MTMYRSQVIDSQLLSLSTVGTASGAIATFDTDKAENLVNLEVAITATGGGGTPSAPIAINGFDKADILVCGKNLFNKTTIELGKFVKPGGSLEPSSDWSASDYILVKPNTTYYLSGITNTGSLAQHSFYKADKTWISDVSCTTYQITTPNECCYIRLSLHSLTPDATQLEIGSTATSYTPYTGTLYAINFGQTVYDGSLNVGSGVLTVTHGYICLYDYSWQYNSDFAVFETGEIHGKYYPSEFICTDYECSMVSSVGSIPNNSGLLRPTAMYMKNTDYTDATQFKNSLTNTYMVYELATPTTIQLDSKQIQSIIGTNNVYVDTGDIIDLKFVLSVGQAVS